MSFLGYIKKFDWVHFDFFFQMSAKQQVEKRYKQVLQKEGFCEDEISKLISTIEEEELSGTRSSLKSHWILLLTKVIIQETDKTI